MSNYFPGICCIVKHVIYTTHNAYKGRARTQRGSVLDYKLSLTPQGSASTPHDNRNAQPNAMDRLRLSSMKWARATSAWKMGNFEPAAIGTTANCATRVRATALGAILSPSGRTEVCYRRHQPRWPQQMGRPWALMSKYEKAKSVACASGRDSPASAAEIFFAAIATSKRDIAPAAKSTPSEGLGIKEYRGTLGSFRYSSATWPPCWCPLRHSLASRLS